MPWGKKPVVEEEVVEEEVEIPDLFSPEYDCSHGLGDAFVAQVIGWSFGLAALGVVVGLAWPKKVNPQDCEEKE